MNKKEILNLIVCGIIGCGIAETAAAGNGCCCAATTARASTSVSALSDSEARDLLYIREEEKLARDVYNAMHERYNQRVFSNIPRAEQFHMDAMLGLLNTYGLKDPVKAKPGAFSNTELQALYDDLVARGSTSRQEAFLVGALVEEVDIEDIQEAMKRTDKKDLLAVYENLVNGSKRHLNAFVRNYEAASGKTYKAQKLTQQAVDGMLGR